MTNKAWLFVWYCTITSGHPYYSDRPVRVFVNGNIVLAATEDFTGEAFDFRIKDDVQVVDGQVNGACLQIEGNSAFVLRKRFLPGRRRDPK